MKHCAKKLLGLAFALALCLAVGGTALAETPVLAAVLAALPGQETLADEPNVTAEPGTTVTGELERDGYTVTIPTTVTVNSGTNEGKLEVKGELEVNAQLKQYRTLNIGIASQNNWKLKYQGADPGTTTPEVGYELEGYADSQTSYHWYCNPTLPKSQLVFVVAQPSAGTLDALNWYQDISAKIPITVPTPSQATMSGTYSDTLTFTFDLAKQCVTYTINVYHQEMQLTGNRFNRADNAPNYQALKMVDKVGTDGEPTGGAKPDEVYTLEYGFANGAPVGNPPETWTRPRTEHGVSEDEDTRCWEDLTYPLNLQQNYNADKKDIVVNLNLVRKWCWLDVNGITNKENCTDCGTDGNQGSKIASFVNIKVSDGKNWSVWYWYTTGDDYWGTFPYGTEFQLGLHRVKDGYAYDADADGNVAIYANGEPKQTTSPPISENGTTYRVYQGKLEGEPVDKTLHPTTSGGGNVHEGAGGKALPRYCYNVCFVDGITYYANGGTGGREDTNRYHGEHTTFKYTDSATLADPLSDDLTGCKFTAPAGKKFAGWSTTPDYTAGQKLYAAGADVSSVDWLAKTGTSHNDTLPTTDGQTKCRTLYAQWGYDITVQFEDEKGYSKNNGTSIVPELGNPMSGYSFTLKGQVVADGADWTLNLNDPTVKKKIDEATTQAKSDAGDDDTKTGRNLERKIWKIDTYTEDGHDYDFTDECTIKAADLKAGKRTLTIQRRRYLLSVISADIDTISVNAIATNADKDEFGTFNVTVDGISNVGVTGKSHCQVGLNYGAKYTVSRMTGVGLYSPMGTEGAVVLKSLKAGDKIDSSWFTNGLVVSGQSYTGYMTGKQTDVHYYTGAGVLAGDGYTGDPVRVAFNDSSNSTAKPSRAPAKKALTVRYHANFDPTEEAALDLDPNPLLDDMDEDFGFDPDPLPEDVDDDPIEGAVMTVTYKPDENVVLRHCMFKRGGYVFVGWNTEKDGTGIKYEVDGRPITDWAAGATVDLYAQWEKPHHMKPVWDDEPTDPADPATPPEWVDDVFGVDPAQPEGMDDAFGVDPAAQPEAQDDAFGVDPAAQPEGMDDAFGVDPDPLPECMDDAFGV